MNARLQGFDDRKLLRFEAELADRLEVLFRECPALCGFTVEADLAAPSNITCHLMETFGEADKIVGRVAGLLVEVMEEEPQAVELLRGRTFARSLH
ncbi:MAG: hypothetical protein ACT4P4_02190 [Betaproteobacteria bacterium]